MTQAAPTSIRPPQRSDWLRDATSMLVSAVCHLTAFIVIGLLAVGSSERWHGNTITVDLGGSSDTPSVDANSLEDGPSAPDRGTPADGAALADSAHPEVPTDLATGLGPASEVEVSPPDMSELAESSVLSNSSTTLSGPAGRLASGSGGKGHGGGSGEGRSIKASTEFFGIGGYGQTFVYVVDCSDSMNERGKFERARY